LLHKSGITRPKSDVVARAVKGNPDRLKNIHTQEEAREYYYALENCPGSSTRGHFTDANCYELDGDAENMPAGMIYAFDKKGKRFIFKPLKGILSPMELQAERTAAEKLNAGPHLVHTTYLEAKMESGEGFGGLLMTEYTRTLLTMEKFSPQLNDDSLLSFAHTMIKAVNYVHALGLVHMDIKQHNIFLDSEGDWFLGDFGGCVKEGEGVRECTEVLLPRTGEECSSVLGKPAEWRFDWMMLAAVFAEQLDVSTNVAVNSKDYIAIEGIRARFDMVQSNVLKELLGRMLLCNDMTLE
jgi:serine/threonine protein kinase